MFEKYDNKTEFIFDYDEYEMNLFEKIKLICLCYLVIFGISYLFYNRVLISAVIACLAVFYPRYKKRQFIITRKEELTTQFRDAMYSLSSALSVGRSLENAFKSARNDLRIIYPDENILIIREFEHICRKLELNQPIEKLLEGLALRTKIDDIYNFAQVVLICRKCGGNMVKVMSNTANIIREKIEVHQEIKMSLAKQKYEQKILNFMPVCFIALLRLGGGGYVDPLFGNLTGFLITTLSITIIGFSYYIAQKVTDIRM